MCGRPMVLLDHTTKTDHDVATTDALCENCLHLVQVISRKGQECTNRTIRISQTHTSSSNS